MNPAAEIITKLGGYAVVSSFLGVAYTAPYRWTYSRERGGTGGIVPNRHVPSLLKLAAEQGIELSAADFLPAAPAPASEPCEAAA